VFSKAMLEGAEVNVIYIPLEHARYAEDSDHRLANAASTINRQRADSEIDVKLH
jgi:hypothetical protein